MPARKPGNRHILLLYRFSLNRLWKPTLLLALVLGAVATLPFFVDTPMVNASNEGLIFTGALISLAFAAFAFVARSMAFVQAMPDRIVVGTPFLRLKISYRRVRSIHPTSFAELFPPANAGWANREFLLAFAGKTAVVVELKHYPMKRALLRLFLPPQMFSPRSTGLVLVVQDWMAFSTELDSLMGAWLQEQSRRTAGANLNIKYRVKP